MSTDRLNWAWRVARDEAVAQPASTKAYVPTPIAVTVTGDEGDEGEASRSAHAAHGQEAVTRVPPCSRCREP
jgi:hypothetical protein